MNLFEPVKLYKTEEIYPAIDNPLALFLKGKKIKIGLALFSIILIFTIFGPLFSPYTYDDIHLPMQNLPPCKAFWFGSDELGRDIYTRLWWGARISLSVGFLAASIDLIIGVIWGVSSGFLGGKVDEIMMRIADSLSSIPYLLLVIVMTVIIGPGFFTIILAISLTGWINMARITRSQILQIKSQDFVLAAHCLGASKKRIIFTHLIPNVSGSIITTMMLSIPQAIFTEAFLSFLGLGIQAPVSSWGIMISDSINALQYYPWRLFFPAGAIVCVMLSFNLIGERLNDVLNPKRSL